MMFGVVGADAIDWNYGYFQGPGSQRKRVKRRLPRVIWCGKGPPNTKARRDGAFKKKVDGYGSWGTELRDRLGEIWVLRAKGPTQGKEEIS